MSEVKFYWVDEESEIYAAESEQQAREWVQSVTGHPVTQSGEVSGDIAVWLDEERTQKGTLAELAEQVGEVPTYLLSDYN